MMTPSLQLPPRPNGASQRVMTWPPSVLTFFSFPSAKKPMAFPLDDQKGNVAPSVPSNGSAVNLSNGRTQTRAVPFALTATKASFEPSGLSATEPPASPMRLKAVPSGGKTKDRLEGRTRVVHGLKTISRVRLRTARATQSSHRWVLLFGVSAGLVE